MNNSLNFDSKITIFELIELPEKEVVKIFEFYRRKYSDSAITNLNLSNAWAIINFDGEIVLQGPREFIPTRDYVKVLMFSKNRPLILIIKPDFCKN